MNTMLHCFSEMNPWMDCIVLINYEDKEMAINILEKAFDEFWDDDADSYECYGDQIEMTLTNANIQYAIQYGETFEDYTTERYDNFVKALSDLFDNEHFSTVII